MGAKKLEGICLPAFGYCQQLRMVCGLVHISDRKLLQKIREKKIAMGHKPDDHEEQGWGGMSM